MKFFLSVLTIVALGFFFASRTLSVVQAGFFSNDSPSEPRRMRIVYKEGKMTILQDTEKPYTICYREYIESAANVALSCVITPNEK